MKYMSDFIIYLYTMDKLIELLNEYESGSWISWIIKGGEISMIGCDDYGLPCIDSYKLCIISKSYGFIDWLVKNDKIDLKEFHKLCGIINQDSEYWNGTPQDYEQVIMYLSISDYPIEDLISILR